jgi:hypothetical protein
MNQVKPRGIALISALMTAALLTVLVGAFLTVNRANSAITGNVVARQAAQNVCLSALHYVWGELERDQAFGAEGFPTGVGQRSFPDTNPILKLKLHGDRDNPDDLNANYIKGEIVATGETFEVKFVNNISNRHVLTETQLGDIPGRCVRLEVLGVSSKSELRLSAVLRKTPYVDTSALSSDDMKISLLETTGTAWSLKSTDPYVNQVRSNSKIVGPSALDSQLKFQERPRGGVALAHEDIELGGRSVLSSPTFKSQSEEAAGGSFEAGAPEIEVPDLERSNLAFPSEVVTLPPGDIQMGIAKSHKWESTTFFEGTVDEVVRWRKKVYDHNSMVHAENTWVSETSTLASDSGEISGPSDGFAEPDSEEGFQNLDNPPGPLDDRPILYSDGEVDSEHKMVADLQTGQITLSPGTTFQVDGELRFIQNEEAPQAHLFFGYEFTPDGPVFMGGNNAAEEPEKNSAALTTTDDLFIDGIITGFGSIYSDGEVDMRAKSGLRAEKDLAVAVHGERIRFTAEEPPESSATNTLSDLDFEVYAEAMGPGYDSYKEWHEQDLGDRFNTIGWDPENPTGLRSKRLSHGPDYYWDKLKDELDLGEPPDWSAAPFGSDWTDGMSFEEYIRLKHWAENEHDAWLEKPGPNFSLVTDEINNRIGVYSNWAVRMNLPMQDYMQQDVATVADIFFVGLVHAGSGGFIADANEGSMLFEGSLVSQGTLDIQQSKAVDFIYNRDYLDDVVKQFQGSSQTSLDQVYFRLQ